MTMPRGSLAIRLIVALFVVDSVSPWVGHAMGQEKRDEPVPMSMGSPAGARTFRPGRWSQVGIEIANPTDEPATVSTTFQFRTAPDFHFRRDLWLLPQSKRLATCSVLAPDLDERESREMAASEKSYELECVVSMNTPSGTRTLSDYGGALKRTTYVSRNTQPMISAMFPDEPSMDTSYATSYDMLVAARIAAGHTRRMGEFSRPLYPDSSQNLDAVDNILLHCNVPFAHPATVGALRDWLLGGGRLWIMLERVDESHVQWLLGDRYQCSVIDRVDLTELQIESTMFGGAAAPANTYERPVPMVRVDARHVEVAHTANGWPAAFFQSFGRGRVLFTTIGPEAWVRHYDPNERRSNDPDKQAVFAAQPALDDLAGAFFATPPEPALTSEDLRPYLAEKIGYRIVGRRPIFIILALFVGVLAVGGGWLRRANRGRAIAWFAPALAVFASIPIGLIGFLRQHEVPPTAAIAQIAVMNPDSPWVNVSGTMALYQQEAAEVPVASNEGGYWLPERHGLEGTTREIVWRDREEWAWETLRLPGGVREARFQVGVTLPNPVRLEATVGPRGIEGRLSGIPAQGLSDGLILMPDFSGIAVRFQEDGTFLGELSGSLARGRFSGEAILNDEQRRRHGLWDAIYARHGKSPFPAEPTLFVWAQPLEIGFRLPDEFQPTGSALLYAPIHLHRPVAGTEFVLPHSFLPMRPVAGPTGRGIATTYQPATGEWLKMSLSSDTWLRIQFPTDLLPIDLDRLTIRLQLNVPSRIARLAAIRDNLVVALVEKENASGMIEHEITDPTLLKVDETGGLLLGLLVGDSLDPDRRGAEWSVQDLRLSARGRVP